jgi:hypothetical protein
MLGAMLARVLSTAAAATVAAAGAIALAGACHHTPKTTKLAAAGTNADDGSGLLAKASVKFLTSEDEGGFEPEQQRTGGYYDGYYGGYYNSFTYGGFGGDGYGESFLYAGYQPYMQYQTPSRTPEYGVVYATADAGGIEGTVTWPKPPAHPATFAGPGSCGTLDNDSVVLGAGNTVVGAVVYLEKIVTGRGAPFGSKPLFVGGTLEQRGCRLMPRVQIAGPLPAQLVISNDDDLRTTLAVTKLGDGGARVEYPLEPGGSKSMGVMSAGVTKIEDTAAGLAPAWVISANHPYFTLTDDQGRFRIDDVIAGDYNLIVWQAPVITGVVNGAVQYGEPVVVTKKVTVKKVTATKLKIDLPAS